MQRSSRDPERRDLGSNRTPVATVELIIRLRRQLTRQGLDAGADTIAWHLQHHHRLVVSRSTIYRTLKHAGLITPAPKKKPKSSYIRFEAEQPNETWQSDVTHHRLTNNRDVEIITWLDDHSRYALSVTAHHVVTGQIVVNTFRTAIAEHGIPFSTLTDNGLIYTARFANGGNTSRNTFEQELIKHRVRQKNSRPSHPTTCGNVERFQQTLKRWLRAQPPANTITELQARIDAFVDHYNHHRPHRSLERRTPAAIYTTRPKASPNTNEPDQTRLRRDRINNGRVSLRINGHMHHIGLGRTLDGTRIIMLINGYNIRIITETTGELPRKLTIDPNRRYHGTGRPPDGPTGPRKPQRPNPK